MIIIIFKTIYKIRRGNAFLGAVAPPRPLSIYAYVIHGDKKKYKKIYNSNQQQFFFFYNVFF